MSNEKEVTANICGFEGSKKGNYIGGESVNMTEVERRMKIF